MSLSSCVCIYMNDCKELSAYFHEWVWVVVCVFPRMSVRRGVRIFVNECEERCAYFHEWVWCEVCVFSWTSVRRGVRIFMNESVWSGWAYMWSVYPSNRRMRLVSGGRNWKSTKSTGIARWFTIGREQREVKNYRWKTQLKLKTADASIHVYVVLVKSYMLYSYPRLKRVSFGRTEMEFTVILNPGSRPWTISRFFT
jgi:hypothetical protein